MVGLDFLIAAIFDVGINLCCTIGFIIQIIWHPRMDDGSGTGSNDPSSHDRHDRNSLVSSPKSSGIHHTGASTGVTSGGGPTAPVAAAVAPAVTVPMSPNASSQPQTAGAPLSPAHSPTHTAHANKSSSAHRNDDCFGRCTPRRMGCVGGGGITPVKWWLHVLGLCFGLVAIVCGIDRQGGLGVWPYPGLKVTVSFAPLYSFFIFQSFAVVVYFSLSALYKQIRAEPPLVTRWIIMASFLLLPVGFASSVAKIMLDRQWGKYNCPCPLLCLE